MESPPLQVVLPCLNEAHALPGVLASLPFGYEAIVVDNGSTDGSARIAHAAGARVIHEARPGYGAAVHAGVVAADTELVAVCDADGSFDLRQLPELAALVWSDQADLVLGRRRPRRLRDWPLHARLANAFLAARIRKLTGVRLHDLGPMRVARRSALLGLGIRDRRSGYPLELVLRAAAAGWRISEREVDYLPRSGRSKVTGTVRGTVTAIRDMGQLLAEAGR